MNRSRSRIVAIAGFVGVFPALVIVALLAFEFSIPIDGFRARVGTLLSDALGCPVTIGGSLHVVTGMEPGIEGRDVRLQECRLIRVARASADRVRVRVRLAELFSREVRLVEIAGERLDVEVPSDAPAPTPAGAPVETPSRWSFAGITHLEVAPARVLIRRVDAAPLAIDLTKIDGSAQAEKPMQFTLRGTHGGEAWEVTVATATLREAIAGPERWPLDFKASFAGANGSLRGSWTPAPLGVAGDVTLESAAAERVFKAIDVDAPELGRFEMTAGLAASRDHVSLDRLRTAGRVGAISGQARLAMHDRRPKFNITLSADEIDFAALERWRSLERRTVAGSSRAAEEIVARMLALLRELDGEVAASFKRVANAPFPATGAKYSSRLEAGQMKVAVSATIDGAPGEASLEIDARGPYALAARASVKSLPRTAITQASGLAEIDARIGGLNATLSARGATVESLLDDVQGHVAGKDIRLTIPLAGHRHEVRLRTAEATAERGTAFRASARGTVSGESLELDLIGGPIADVLDDHPWDVKRLDVRLGAARARTSGRIERPLTAIAGKLSVELDVSHLDRLVPLVGGARLPRVPGTLRGSIDVGGDAWRIDATTLAIGATRGKGHAAGRKGMPVELVLDLQAIAGDEFAGLGTSSPSQSGDKSAGDNSAPDLPDLDLSLKARTASYAGETFERIAVEARVRDGAARAPYSLDWAGARIEGTLEAKPGKESIRFGGDATARGLDIARLPGPLAKQGITGKIDRLAIRIDASGAAREALLKNAAFSVDVAGASMTLPKSDAIPDGARVMFGGRVEAQAAAPIEVSIKGAYRDRPFTASGQLPRLDALFPEGRSHAVRVALEYDRSRLEAAGDATLDADKPRFSGTVNVSGDTLHTLADLAGFSLPPLGPYKVSATVDADSSQVKAHDLAMQLGKSRFNASLAAENRKVRPKIAAKVRGLPVHLEDIGAKAWSPENVEARAVEESKRGKRIDAATLDRDARVITRMLRAFDFDLDVTLDEVSAAGEKVGRGELKARLDDGRLAVNPLSLWIDQGLFRAEMGVDVRGKVPQYTVKFEGTGFEYGPLMRAVNPGSPHRGTLDLSMDIRTSGVPETLKQNATGSLDVLILPREQSAGSLDLLGAGVLRLFMRTLDPRSQSRLNCIVAGFNLKEGIATSEIVLLDTTLARVAGDLVVDFRSRALSGRFAPRSKQPQFFPVAPGIRVGGTLDDPDVGVSAQSIVLGALRIWQFPVAFATDWLSNDQMPADGTPDCRAAYRHVLN